VIGPHQDGDDVPLAPGPEVGLCRIPRGVAPLVAQDEPPVALVLGVDHPIDPPHTAPVDDLMRSRVALAASGRRDGVLAIVVHLSARFYSV